ncbi:MAG: hypothetical protein ACOX3G_03770 [Armatimonadota bacterium]
MTHKTQILVLSLVLVVLTLPALAASEMIPVAEGNKWTYDCYRSIVGAIMFQGRVMSSLNDLSFGSSVYEILSVDNKANPPVFEYRESVDTASATGGSGSHSQIDIKFVQTERGQEIASTNRSATVSDEGEKQDYSPALLYYMRDAAPGKQWDVGGMRDAKTEIPMKAKAVGKETVTVPAGTFKDCLKVVYYSDTMTGSADIWGKEFNVTSGRTRGVYWIADGVGVVKELEIAESEAETIGPDGKTPLRIESYSCDVRELKPGFVVKK